MVTLTAVKIGVENWVIKTGDQSPKPAPTSFGTPTNPGNFENFSVKAYSTEPGFVQSSTVGFPCSMKYYSITNSGIMQFSGSNSITNPIVLSTPQSVGYAEGNVACCFMTQSTLAGTGPYQYQFAFSMLSANAIVNAGVQGSSPAVNETTTLLGPIIVSPGGASYFGTTIFRINNGSGITFGAINVFYEATTDSNTHTLICKGAGSTLNLFNAWVHQTDNDFTYANIPAPDGYNYAYNVNSHLVKWHATNLASAADFTEFTTAFDDPTLTDVSLDCFDDGTYFYLVYIASSSFTPIQPYILKVKYDWSTYTRINIVASDPLAQARLDLWLIAQTNLPNFYYSFFDKTMYFTSNNIDGYYGYLVPSVINLNRPRQGQIIKLPRYTFSGNGLYIDKRKDK